MMEMEENKVFTDVRGTIGPFDGQDRIEVGYDIKLDSDRI
jgi:hypothetical protein